MCCLFVLLFFIFLIFVFICGRWVLTPHIFVRFHMNIPPLPLSLCLSQATTGKQQQQNRQAFLPRTACCCAIHICCAFTTVAFANFEKMKLKMGIWLAVAHWLGLGQLAGWVVWDRMEGKRNLFSGSSHLSLTFSLMSPILFYTFVKKCLKAYCCVCVCVMTRQAGAGAHCLWRDVTLLQATTKQLTCLQALQIPNLPPSSSQPAG